MCTKGRPPGKRTKKENDNATRTHALIQKGREADSATRNCTFRIVFLQTTVTVAGRSEDRWGIRGGCREHRWHEKLQPQDVKISPSLLHDAEPKPASASAATPLDASDDASQQPPVPEMYTNEPAPVRKTCAVDELFEELSPLLRELCKLAEGNAHSTETLKRGLRETLLEVAIVVGGLSGEEQPEDAQLGMRSGELASSTDLDPRRGAPVVHHENVDPF
mmetsp:Transcript_5677/g.13743  ORF Transcript_5677/g.13743 Transcript_5677/m.13743 type:complete len:220 (-) Transcript_5677:131-790(-)